MRARLSAMEKRPPKKKKVSLWLDDALAMLGTIISAIIDFLCSN